MVLADAVPLGGLQRLQDCGLTKALSAWRRVLRCPTAQHDPLMCSGMEQPDTCGVEPRVADCLLGAAEVVDFRGIEQVELVTKPLEADLLVDRGQKPIRDGLSVEGFDVATLCIALSERFEGRHVPCRSWHDWEPLVFGSVVRHCEPDEQILDLVRCKLPLLD